MSASKENKIEIGYYRWTICALLFFATTINYIDRQIFGILAPLLQIEIKWSESEYGWIVTSFQAAYALGLVLFGWFIDKYGTKIGYAFSVVVWSLTAMAHAIVKTPLGFGAARAGLGLSEAGNFPAAIKTVAEWFPKKERALATGIFNSGANIGAVVAPAIVPWLTLTYGWQAAFIATGAIGFIWLVFWILLYQKPENQKHLSQVEKNYILSDTEEQTNGKVRWLSLFKYRQTWAFVIGKFMTDPIWWFYLYWLPKFLNKTYGLTIGDVGLPLIVIYMMTSVGSIGGGWLSSILIKRGMVVNRSRKLAMLICAVCVVPIITASIASSLWMAVGLIGLAAASHQGFSANLFTMVSDMFPKKAVGSVVGLGGMAGSVSGMLFSISTGYILEWTGSYISLFFIAAPAYLIALGLIQLFTFNAKPVNL
jgi:ACS family hexuronate transporter-like MFS transporter